MFKKEDSVQIPRKKNTNKGKIENYLENVKCIIRTRILQICKHKVRSKYHFQLSLNVVLGCCVQSEINAKSQTKPNAYFVIRPLF